MNLKRFLILLILLLLSLTGLLFFFTLRQGAWAFYVAEGALIVSIIILLIFYSRIVKPIRTLAQGMDMLKMQDFNHRLVAVGQVEADAVAETFNAIIARLRSEQIHTREQEHFLNLLINNSPTAIILLDGESRVSIANNAALSLLGNDILSKKLDEIESPAASVMKNTPLAQTVTLPTDSGQLYKCTHQTFMDSGYSHHFYIVENVTTEISAAQRLAYEKVIRMMSHEVNNTMTGIISTMQMLGDVAQEEEKLRDFSEPIDACVTRSSQLSKFISRIAQVVKIPEPQLVPTDISSVIRNAVAFVSSECERRNISLTCEIADKNVVKGIDADMMQQALVNILKNAQESIGENGHITVCLCSDRILITDDGAGIPDEISRKLFTPFFTTKRGGQGIGLMLVAEILTKHGFRYALATNKATQLTSFAIYF